MSSKQIAAVAGTTVLAVAVVGGSWLAMRGDDSPAASATRATPASAVIVTAFPDLPAPTGDPELADLASAAPPTGAVAEVSGPFDDRFSFTDLALSGRTVTGAVAVTSDVSELIDLQVEAGFFDRRGRLVGTGRYTYHLDEAHEHDESGGHRIGHDFRIDAPAKVADRVVSAAVGVTVLVNE